MCCVRGAALQRVVTTTQVPCSRHLLSGVFAGSSPLLVKPASTLPSPNAGNSVPTERAAPLHASFYARAGARTHAHMHTRQRQVTAALD